MSVRSQPPPSNWKRIGLITACMILLLALAGILDVPAHRQ